MKSFFPFFLLILFAGALIYVLGDDYRTSGSNCPRQSETADLIGLLIKNCNFKLSILNFYGLDIYPLVSFQYYWSFGGKAILQYEKVYAYFLKIEEKFFYISLYGDCTRLRDLYESDNTFVEGVDFLSYSIVLQTLTRWNVPFYSGCTPLVIRPKPYRKNGLPACNLRPCPGVKFASPSSSNNVNKSAVRTELMENHLYLVFTGFDVHENEFNEYVGNPDTRHGEPKECKPLVYLRSITNLLRDAGIELQYINPDNFNSGFLIGQAFSVGLSAAVTRGYTFSEQVTFFPPGCTNISGFKIVGPAETPLLFSLTEPLVQLP